MSSSTESSSNTHKSTGNWRGRCTTVPTRESGQVPHLTETSESTHSAGNPLPSQNSAEVLEVIDRLIQHHETELARLKQMRGDATKPATTTLAHMVAMASTCHLMQVSYSSTWDKRSRKIPYVKARRVAWHLLRERGYSYPMIAQLTGGWDHTTIMTALKRPLTKEEQWVMMRIKEEIEHG